MKVGVPKEAKNNEYGVVVAAPRVLELALKVKEPVAEAHGMPSRSFETVLA